MRLIDADSLIDLVTDSTILGDGFKTAFCALVNGEPTVKVQKTGKWIWVQYDANPEIGNWHCSVCRFMPAVFNLAKKHLNYCPNCGARMENES